MAAKQTDGDTSSEPNPPETSPPAPGQPELGQPELDQSAPDLAESNQPAPDQPAPSQPGPDIPASVLAQVLSAVVLDVPEQARAVLAAADLEADLRAQLLAALSVAGRQAQAAGLGDVLRARGRRLDPDVNECYRVAFYTGTDWEALAANVLFARFTANKAGQPFDKWIHYFDIYQRTLAPYVGKPVRVLEIGVFHGGGLDQLRALLGEQAQLIGADLDPAARAACAGRFEVAVGDQTDPEFLARLVADYGPFDVIIDDGGHTTNQQITSIEHLFDAVNEGGVYIVEDTHTSYWDSYCDSDESFIEWAKRRADDLNAYHFREDVDLGRWATTLSGVHFYDSVVVFDKRRHAPPFCEVQGTGSFVFADRVSELALLSYRASLDVRTVEMQQAEADRDAALQAREAALAVRDQAVAERDHASANSAELEAIAGSTLGRLARRVREAKARNKS